MHGPIWAGWRTQRKAPNCGPQGLTYLRATENSDVRATTPPDAQFSVKHHVPANLADGLALGLVTGQELAGFQGGYLNSRD